MVSAPDIRLVAVDMDGTLLDDEHRVPPTLWPLLAELRRRGVAFCPASGRQYANLAERFARVADGTPFVAENGAVVVRDDAVLRCDVLDREVVARAVTAVRALTASGADVGAVVCGPRTAYVERHDAAFRREVDRYYSAVVDVDDTVVKVAVHDSGEAASSTEPALAALRDTHKVVLSGAHWVDVQGASTDKGAALRVVQQALGVTRAQTVAFGDHLNDLEMLDAAEHSYAMANAHPDVLARARHTAPANTEDGVVRTLSALLRVPLER